jgi:hypothetical protein
MNTAKPRARPPGRGSSIAIALVSLVFVGTLVSLPFVGEEEGFVSRPPNSTPIPERFATYKIKGLASQGCDASRNISWYFDGYFAAVATSRSGVRSRILVNDLGVGEDSDESMLVSAKGIRFGLQLRGEVRGGSPKDRRRASAGLLSNAFLRDPHDPSSLFVNWPDGFSEVARGFQEVHVATRSFKDREKRIGVLTIAPTTTIRAWDPDWFSDFFSHRGGMPRIDPKGDGSVDRKGFRVAVSVGPRDDTKNAETKYLKRLERDTGCLIWPNPLLYLRSEGSMNGSPWIVSYAAGPGCPVVWAFRTMSAFDETECAKDGLFIHLLADGDTRFIALLAPSTIQSVRLRNLDGSLVPINSSKTRVGKVNAFFLNARATSEAVVIELLDRRGTITKRGGFRYTIDRNLRIPTSFSGTATPLGLSPHAPEELNQLTTHDGE